VISYPLIEVRLASNVKVKVSETRSSFGGV